MSKEYRNGDTVAVPTVRTLLNGGGDWRMDSAVRTVVCGERGAGEGGGAEGGRGSGERGAGGGERGGGGGEEGGIGRGGSATDTVLESPAIEGRVGHSTTTGGGGADGRRQ